MAKEIGVCECCGEYGPVTNEHEPSPFLCDECRKDHPEQLFVGKGCRYDLSNAPLVK